MTANGTTSARPPFNEADLRRLAGKGGFQRGLRCLADGHVTKLDVQDGRVTATVEGRTDYHVQLWGDGKELGYKCSCETSGDGSFCRHAVAAGLAAIADSPSPPTKPPPPAVTNGDVRTHLLGLDKGALVDLLMERSEWDPQLRDRLFMQTAKGRSSAGELDVRALKESLERATETGGYIDWRGASAYAMGVEHAVDALVELFDAGHDADLLEVVECGGRGGEALALVWKEFVERLSLSGYEALKKRADENKCWPEWKKKALECLGELHASASRSSSLRDRSLLVQVFLFEGDVDAALHNARAGGCGEGEWMRLADALEKERPAEAATIYAERLDTMLAHADNDGRRSPRTTPPARERLSTCSWRRPTSRRRESSSFGSEPEGLRWREDRPRRVG